MSTHGSKMSHAKFHACWQAGANVEQLMQDPKMMAEAQRQIQNMMAGAGA